MAKATPADLSAAIDISNALDAINRGFLPPEMPSQSEDGGNRYDATNDAEDVLHHLSQIAARGSLFRVAFGMSVVLDPRNEVVDPDATTLELHPKFGALDTAARRLLAALDQLNLGCNGPGANAGDEVRLAREALADLVGHKSTTQHQNQCEKA